MPWPDWPILRRLARLGEEPGGYVPGGSNLGNNGHAYRML
jgi:hypothetical protein